MHPAPSVILFTTFSGLGFGLLFWLGLGQPAPTGWVAFAFFALAYAMAVGGLLASTFHLGHPERAYLAVTQWRTSWLSREAIAAIATLLTGGVFALLRIWDISAAPLGWLVSLGCLATVFTTAMIYTQMRTVPRWRHWTTPALFLALSLAGGAILANRGSAALVLLALAAVLQLVAWITGDMRLQQSGTTLGTATGLGDIGRVRAFLPPHSGSNYLLREFVYVVGRRHALQLRAIGLILAFGVPIPLIAAGLGHITALVAVLAHIAGVLCLRWLFFAQAEHVVGLYYGKR
ncbi:MAG: dimethyl sulfoxide reductase anchor subunit [Alphaproteobacteria bacterium]|jgi:DMSO reductase anchor subunit|uniref:DMSO reductase anchor subunit n=1 Tax=Loktanella salsilacus TaxID=195913 RepID=A0A1I4HPK6_9RHOB|nr:DmsC/YnfH family molybdoenzyme membrane anchor subunit [Loktanella salsilacus]MBU0860375.1 dimethyl sulfoxide reductase anchor subunit [Alphaproteobacteria bacterium]SFL44228.1 DMSO reductase anchor subunit [Loktanella salsilacus]